MSVKQKRKPYKKIAVALSLCALILWAVLGTGASLAWFSDTSPEVVNIFHIADFDLDVSYRLEDGTYKSIEGETDVFDNDALYEPGFVQVVYLKIENKGDVAFDFKTAVSVTKNNSPSTNALGQQFYLQDYLKFGLIIDEDEAALDNKVANRDLAREAATMKLSNYATDEASLEAGKTVYMAIVVHMPEGIGNEANYRGDEIPKVELGIIATATQQTE